MTLGHGIYKQSQQNFSHYFQNVSKQGERGQNNPFSSSSCLNEQQKITRPIDKVESVQLENDLLKSITFK